MCVACLKPARNAPGENRAIRGCATRRVSTRQLAPGEADPVDGLRALVERGVEKRGVGGDWCSQVASCLSMAWPLFVERSVKENVLPLPSAVSTHMRPPCASTISLAMQSPSPAPSLRVESPFQ